MYFSWLVLSVINSFTLCGSFLYKKVAPFLFHDSKTNYCFGRKKLDSMKKMFFLISVETRLLISPAEQACFSSLPKILSQSAWLFSEKLIISLEASQRPPIWATCCLSSSEKKYLEEVSVIVTVSQCIWLTVMGHVILFPVKQYSMNVMVHVFQYVVPFSLVLLSHLSMLLVFFLLS